MQDIAARWGRFFCCSECGLLCGLGNGWPATGGAGVLAGAGCKAGSEVGPAPCNSPPGAGGGPETGPRGNCVAVMPCGAWGFEIRKSKGPGVAPCFLVCVIGSDCSLFRDLPYNYRAFGAGRFLSAPWRSFQTSRNFQRNFENHYGKCNFQSHI